MIDVNELFNPSLRALMGEWATYFVVYHYRYTYETEFSIDTKFITDTELFETKDFIIGPAGPYDETYHHLDSLGLIVRTHRRNICRATCSYVDIWKNLRTTFLEPKPENVFLFFDCAGGWSDSPLTDSEYEAFTIDQNCRPLFDAFEEENFVESVYGQYFWTNKIRPYLEERRYWASETEVLRTKEKALIENLSIGQKRDLRPFLESKDKASAVAYIKQNLHSEPPLNWNAAERVIETMFPFTFGAPPKTPLHWKWYGEVPSQSKCTQSY